MIPQEINAAECLDRHRDDIAGGGIVAEIGTDGEGRAAGALNIADDLFGPAAVAIDDADRGALARKHQRRGAPRSRGCRRDDSSPPRHAHGRLLTRAFFSFPGDSLSRLRQLRPFQLEARILIVFRRFEG